MEFTLEELFQHRSERGLLTFAAYRELGGVEGALAKRAEATFNDLPEPVQAELPAVFRQLVTVRTEEDTGAAADSAPTRRQAPLASFSASPAQQQFVDAFIAARLFVSDKADDGTSVVRVTHESLLTRWDRLQTWLQSERELLRIRTRVTSAAARWQQEDERPDLLLTAGRQLDEAVHLAGSGYVLEASVTELIAGSKKRAKRNRGMKRMAVAGLGMLTVVAIIFAFVADEQAREAKRQEGEAKKQEGIAHEQAGIAKKNEDEAKTQSKLATKNATALTTQLKESRRLLDLSRMRTAQADFANNSVELARDTLSEIDQENRCLGWRYLNRQFAGGLITFYGHTGTVMSVVLSADGRRLVTGSADNTARLWDVRSGQTLQEFKGHTERVTSVALSADGSRLATGSEDHTARLWDVRSGQCLQEFKGHTGVVTSVALSADGSRLVTGSGDRTARLWDVRSGQSLAREFKGHTRGVTSTWL